MSKTAATVATSTPKTYADRRALALDGLARERRFSHDDVIHSGLLQRWAADASAKLVKEKLGKGYQRVDR